MAFILGKAVVRHVTVNLVNRVKMVMGSVRMENVQQDGLHKRVTQVSTRNK
jgi:hypothetical protein